MESIFRQAVQVLAKLDCTEVADTLWQFSGQLIAHERVAKQQIQRKYDRGGHDRAHRQIIAVIIGLRVQSRSAASACGDSLRPAHVKRHEASCCENSKQQPSQWQMAKSPKHPNAVLCHLLGSITPVIDTYVTQNAMVSEFAEFLQSDWFGKVRLALDIHRLGRGRVSEFNACRVKAEAIKRAATIKSVAANGVAYGGQVEAQLVGAAGLW